MTRLEQLRIDAGLTPQQLAEASGVSYRTVKRIEAGANSGAPFLLKLANALSETLKIDVRASELRFPAVEPDRSAA